MAMEENDEIKITLKIECFGYDADTVFLAAQEAAKTAYVYSDVRLRLSSLMGFPGEVRRTKGGVEMDVRPLCIAPKGVAVLFTGDEPQKHAHILPMAHWQDVERRTMHIDAFVLGMGWIP